MDFEKFFCVKTKSPDVSTHYWQQISGHRYSIKQQKIERRAQVENKQHVRNELKEKRWNLEDRSRRDNLRVDWIPESEEESWDNTDKLLRKELGVNKI